MYVCIVYFKFTCLLIFLHWFICLSAHRLIYVLLCKTCAFIYLLMCHCTFLPTNVWAFDLRAQPSKALVAVFVKKGSAEPLAKKPNGGYDPFFRAWIENSERTVPAGAMTDCQTMIVRLVRQIQLQV